MSNLKEENTVVNSVIWFLIYVCLPITIPMIVYKYMSNILAKSRRSSLRGKVVLITGASSGLGEALAHVFYAQGCKVVLSARRKEELERVKRDLLSNKQVTSVPPIVLPLDLAAFSDLYSKVQNIYDECGNIDILINNGGISTRGNILNTTIDVDVKVMAVNYFGPVVLTKAVLPKMIEHKCGHIVFVSSIQGRIAIPDRSSYAASKHALQAFADCLRAEVHEHNIQVSLISPGYINTALSLNALTATGEIYGVGDEKTASGYSADFVAKQVLDMVTKERKELVLSPLQPKLALAIRYILPQLYFWIMAKRAKTKS